MAIDRKTRRLLLFFITLVTISLVVIGNVFPERFVDGNPVMFLGFWSICFVFAALVIVLSVIDMLMIRREHRDRQKELDAEFTRTVSDAQALAEIDQRTEIE